MFRSESNYVDSKECSLTTSYCASLEIWQNLLLLFTLSLVWLFAIPWTVACQAPPSSTITWSSLKFMSIELVMLSNHLSLCSPLLFCLQSFPASGSFLKSQLLTSGGQSNGASAQATVLSMNIQSGFPSGLTGLISLQSKGLSTVFFSITVWKHQFFSTQTSL